MNVSNNWICQEFIPETQEKFSLSTTLENSTIKITFNNSLIKDLDTYMQIGSINIKHGVKRPNFLKEIQNIFDTPHIIHNDSPQLTKPSRKCHQAISNSKNQLSIYLDTTNSRLKIEKVFSILSKQAIINDRLKVKIAKTYHLREYALESSFLHDVFENLKKEIKSGSIKTFLLAIKRRNKLNNAKTPRGVQYLIISFLINSPNSNFHQNYYQLALKEKIDDSKKLNDHTDKHKCILN